jgi:hypothetical protein
MDRSNADGRPCRQIMQSRFADIRLTSRADDATLPAGIVND